MGLLDDAIREHLDLKRRRGADPAEVARLEQEALGPVRREPAPADGQAEPQPAAEPAAATPPADAPAVAESHPADEAFPADDRTHVLAPDERHEGAHGDPLRDHVAPEPERPDPSAAAPEPTPEDPPAADPRNSDIVHQPTTEFRVEDQHDDEDQAAPGRPSDDVLEETPDFLQETPEHDRLWFEQRPPRDFDFDG
jgi:hypothetical protein